MDSRFDEAASSLEATVRRCLANGDRMRAIGECRVRLDCDFDTAHTILRLTERLPRKSREIRDAMRNAVEGQSITPHPLLADGDSSDTVGAPSGGTRDRRGAQRTPRKTPSKPGANQNLGCIGIAVAGFFMALLIGQCNSNSSFHSPSNTRNPHSKYYTDPDYDPNKEITTEKEFDNAVIQELIRHDGEQRGY